MAQDTVVLFTAATIGRGDDELGAVLTRNFLRMMRDTEHRPATVLFMNSGVLLTVEGSPVLEEVTAIAAAGVELLSCGTCLDFYKLREKVAAGRASNMGEIYLRLQAAAKVITV